MAYPHDQVAHNWAHQTGHKTRGHNVYYDGATIYSYGPHFPIARHTVDANGNPVVLFTTDSHSVSTAKHKTIVWRACRGLVVFDVADVGANTTDDHVYNFDKMQEAMAARIDKASRARTRRDWLLGGAQGIANRANQYREAFKLGRRRKPLTMPDDIAAYLATRKAEIATAERKAQRERLEREREAREKWLAGHGNWRGYGEHGSALVRVMSESVQTSLGVTVPISEAVKVFRVMRACREHKRQWQRNGETLQAGTWQIDKIDEHGNLRAGCHFITWKAAKPAAEKLGLV